MSDDHRRVETLLGRSPRGAYSVVVRSAEGDPVVIANAPLLDDGTPMPTRYWLVGPAEIRAVGRLEAAGGVAAAEAAIDPEEIDAAHERYRTERDALIDPDHTGPRPSGGVGGTRTGVKCLHAHYAWYLAGGDDPVGRWVAERLAESAPLAVTTPLAPTDASVTAATIDTGRPSSLLIEFGTDDIAVAISTGSGTEPSILATLATSAVGGLGLFDHDPPAPAALTNAIGLVDDALGDLIRHHPDLTEIAEVVFTGPLAETLARVEIGADDLPGEVVLGRSAVEEVFRTMATETRADRVFNPGLPTAHVDDIVIACCAAVAIVRHLDLGLVTVVPRHDRLGT